jgi:hypothetical protein
MPRQITNTESSEFGYAFGGGGSGVVSTDTSVFATYNGVVLAGVEHVTRCSRVLTVVVTLQLDIASQQRLWVGVAQSVAWRAEPGSATCALTTSLPVSSTLRCVAWSSDMEAIVPCPFTPCVAHARSLPTNVRWRIDRLVNNAKRRRTVGQRGEIVSLSDQEMLQQWSENQAQKHPSETYPEPPYGFLHPIS